MTSIGSNGGSSSGASSSGRPLACAWVSLTLEEQLENFKRIIHNQHSNISFDGAFNFKVVARAVKELRIDPCVDMKILLPFLEDLEHVGVPEHIGTMEYILFGTTPLHWAVLMDDRTMVRYILTSRRVDINASTRYWGETALHYAIIGGNHGIVEDLLEPKVDEKVDVNLHNAFGYTPLHCAAKKGYVDIVTCLLQHNANIYALNHNGWSPLHFAAKEGAMNIVTLLVERNADVDALTKDGLGPLHIAVGKGYLDIVTCLVDHNANVNALDNDGLSPLHIAIVRGHADIAKCLVEHNADVDALTKDGLCPLHIAAGKGYLDIVTCLVDHNANVNTLDNDGLGPLHLAAKEGAMSIVTLLLEWNANVDALTNDGLCPLHIATREGYLDIVTCLVDHNANVNALDNDGLSPLHIAIAGGYADIATCLVEHNADVDALTKDGLCPLHIATRKGYLDIVTCLVDLNANVNALDNDGLSPLHFAAKEGAMNIVTLLVERNANVDALTNDGLCPLHIATREGYLDIVTCLVDHNASVNALDNDGLSPLHIAIVEGYVDIATCLIEHNADVDVLTKDGLCPLHIAAGRGYLDIVTYLVDHNANVNTLTKDGHCLLHYSITMQWIDTSSKLIAVGADVHIKDKEDNNALHLAIQAHDRKHNMMNIVKLLRELDVDPDAKNSQGYSPFFVAVVEGHTEVVKELLRSKEKIKLMEECNGQTAIQIAFDNGHEYIKRALLECDDVSRYVGDLYRDRQVYVDAANAILVGAALIASVTFASWLQPPLGYTTSYLDLAPSSSDYVDVQHNVSLRVFWVFNALSFYFAIGTVVFGARSVLPRRQMFIKATVEKLHRNLLVTSILLACSVFFVIIAFGIAGCIVLTPTLKFQWYMIVPTIFGGLVCLISLGFLFKSMVEDNLEKKRKKESICLYGNLNLINRFR